MMAWIESHQSLKEHPKTKRLVRALGVPLPTVLGHLHLMWWYCLDFAPDGDLSFDKFTVEDIADMAQWPGDAHAFVQALCAAGFLEQDEQRLLIHDWFDYAGKLIVKREANAERMREARAAQEKPRATHVQRTSRARAGATVPYRTVPSSLRSEELTPPTSDAFADFFAAYPRHDARAAALKAWNARTAGEQNRAMAELPRWKGCEQWQDPKYIPQASTYLNQRRFDDELPPPSHTPSTNGNRYQSQADHNQLRRDASGKLINVH